MNRSDSAYGLDLGTRLGGAMREMVNVLAVSAYHANQSVHIVPERVN